MFSEIMSEEQTVLCAYIVFFDLKVKVAKAIAKAYGIQWMQRGPT